MKSSRTIMVFFRIALIAYLSLVCAVSSASTVQDFCARLLAWRTSSSETPSREKSPELVEYERILISEGPAAADSYRNSMYYDRKEQQRAKEAQDFAKLKTLWDEGRLDPNNLFDYDPSAIVSLQNHVNYFRLTGGSRNLNNK